MYYLIGGAPRAGKSILAAQFAAEMRIGWISTDPLVEILRVANMPGVKMEWDATPEAISFSAQWMFPYLERFVWSVSGIARSYIIEGVDILPAQVATLSERYDVRSVFLGNAGMTLDRFDRFPGRSLGYAKLPVETRQQFADDVPAWSNFIRQEAEAHGYPYIDTSDNFPTRLKEAEAVLTGNT